MSVSLCLCGLCLCQVKKHQSHSNIRWYAKPLLCMAWYSLMYIFFNNDKTRRISKHPCWSETPFYTWANNTFHLDPCAKPATTTSTTNLKHSILSKDIKRCLGRDLRPVSNENWDNPNKKSVFLFVRKMRITKCVCVWVCWSVSLFNGNNVGENKGSFTPLYMFIWTSIELVIDPIHIIHEMAIVFRLRLVPLSSSRRGSMLAYFSKPSILFYHIPKPRLLFTYTKGDSLLSRKNPIIC